MCTFKFQLLLNLEPLSGAISHTAASQGRIARIDAVSGMDVVVVFEQTSALEVRVPLFPFPPFVHVRMCLLCVAERGSHPSSCAVSQVEEFDHVHSQRVASKYPLLHVN